MSLLTVFSLKKKENLSPLTVPSSNVCYKPCEISVVSQKYHDFALIELQRW